MAYDPKNNSIYLVSGDSYSDFFVHKGAAINFYFLRQSQRDLVGSYIYLIDPTYNNACPNNHLTDSSKYNELSGIYFQGAGSTVTFGAETNGASGKTVLDVVNTYDMTGSNPAKHPSAGTTAAQVEGYWGNTNQTYIYNQYTIGVHFEKDGTIDFANATGNVAMSEDIKLQYSILNVLNSGNIYTSTMDFVKYPAYSFTTDVATLYSEGTLTIEGSLYSHINASAITDHSMVNFKNASNMVIDRRRLVASGLRGENITLELNMAGTVNTTIADQIYLDFVKTSYEYVTIQASGLLADGSCGYEYGLSIPNGTISFGNSVGGANSVWTGSVNTAVSNIVLGTQIYKLRIDCEYDAAGNPLQTNGKVVYQNYAERDTNSYGNRDGNDPETGEDITEWAWSVIDVGNVTASLIDPDFHEDSNVTDISNNTVAAHGLYGSTVELGNMTASGSINASVKDIVLYGEYAYGSGDLSFHTTYDTTGKPTNDTAKHLYTNKPGVWVTGVTYTNNKTTATAIQAGTLKINGDFSGTLKADISGVKTVTTATEFKYEYRKWMYQVYQIQVGAGNSQDAVVADNFKTLYTDAQLRSFYNADLGVFIDPTSRYQIDLRFDSRGNIVGTGYLLSPSGDGSYEDPVTGGYIDPATGLVYSKNVFTSDNQLFKGDDIVSTVNGFEQSTDPTPASKNGMVYGDAYESYLATVQNAVGDKRGVYYWLYEKKDSNGNNVLNSDMFVITANSDGTGKTCDWYNAVVDRVITQSSKESMGFNGSAIGIDASTITINGQFDNKIEVRVDNSIFDNLTVIGINASSSLTASNGLFAPEIHIVVNDDVTVSSYTVNALNIGKLTAEALAGTYYVYSGNLISEALDITTYDSSFDNDADPSTFNIIADVYAQNFVFANATETALRFSGTLYAGKTLDASGNWITVSNQYVYFAANSDTNENLDLAAGADTFGNWHFGLGFDTLTIDSNAHMEGNIYVGKFGQMGTFNLIFNLNDQVLKESDRNTGKPVLEGQFMTEDGLGTASPTMIAISLNDVVLKKDAQGNILSNSYTILGNQKQAFVDRMETVQLKYDGLSLATCGLEGVELVAEIGYYDGNGVWIRTAVGDGTGFEFRQNNFTATIGIYNGVKNSTGITLGNVIRVYDSKNNDAVIFEAHSEYNYNAKGDDGTVTIVVDVLPDMVVRPNGETYYTSMIDTGIENLHEWYNVEDKTLTVTFDDHSVDISNMSYQFEYYIQTLDENGNVIDETNTIVREIKKSTDLNPRTSVVLDGIASNQKVIWRVRQILGSGIENSGEWRSIDDYEFMSPQDLYQTATETGYTLEWKNELTSAQSSAYTYIVTYTLIDAAGNETVKTVYAAASDARKISCNIDTEGKRLLSWNVAIADIKGNIQSEISEYHNLQMERVVLATPSDFKVQQDENGDVVFSWSNSCKSTDVYYKLEYRVGNETNDYNGGWITVYVKADQAVDAKVYYTTSLELPTSAEVLDWRVTAYQQNGEETRISTTGIAQTVVKSANDGSALLYTTPQTAEGTANNVTFVWNYNNDINQAFLLEYTQSGATKSVLISLEEMSAISTINYFNEIGAIDYVYDAATDSWKYKQDGVELTDLRNISFSCQGNGWTLTYNAAEGKVYYTVAHGAASGTIDWRVRERDINGELTVDNKWYIFETEAVENFNCQYNGVTDPFTGKKSRTATLTFESNAIGSSYRLEYVIINNGATTTYESPVVVTYNNVNTKYFSYDITGLAANGSQSIAWRVSVKEAGDTTWSEWQYPQIGMEEVFDGTYLLDSPTNAENLVNKDASQTEGKSAVASLTWTAGENITNGLNRYVVEYFQTTEALTAEDITKRFESNTAWDGSILNGKYARVEVTNNELTLTGLRDTQYVYWRVCAVDNKENVSAWAVGDPVHVYLEDKYAPSFSETPLATQKWVAHEGDDTRDPSLRDIYLTWKGATDDKVGVKRYEFKLTGGTAAELEFAEFYYSLDGGKNWLKLDYSDGVGYIEHMDKVSSYQVKVTNVGNATYGWELTAKDYQNNSTKVTASGAWLKDSSAPTFAQQDKDYIELHEGYTDIAISMGCVLTQTGEFCMTPTMTWTPAGDDLKFNQDYSQFSDAKNGSGVAYYIVEWTMYNTTFSVKIDVDDLTLNSEGKYTWTLDPYELLAQNLDKVNSTTGYPLVVPNQEYAWKFYAVDNAGNKSVALTPQDSDQNWKPDAQAPVFTSVVTDEPVVKEVGSKRDVTVTWEGATNYWFDPDEDPVTAGSGVDYYTFTYWSAGSAQISITVDADDYTLDANGKKRYSVSVFVSNADYEFTITATDICGNTTKLNESISGAWTKNDNPAVKPPCIIDADTGVSYNAGNMYGHVGWTEPGEYAGADVQYYILSCEGQDGCDMQGRILSGFAGDNAADFSAVANFTKIGDNRWVVIFKDDATQRYTLEYNTADGSYTMKRTVSVDGNTYDLVLTYGQGKYNAAYQVAHDDYAWDLQIKEKDAVPDFIYSDIWQGDSSAPELTQSAILGVLDYVKGVSHGESVRTAEITITIDNTKVDDLGSGVAYYLVEWGTEKSGLYDNSFTIYADQDGDGVNEKSVAYTFAVPDGTYQYRVTAYDYAGNKSDVVAGPELLMGDIRGPRIETPVVPGSEIAVGSNSMKAEITWTAGEDDKHVEFDNKGVGIKEYEFILTDSNNRNYTFVIKGDDFEDESLQAGGFVGYQTRVITIGGVQVTTYCKTYKFDNEPIRADLTYYCAYTDANGNKVEGHYNVEFSNLTASDYKWKVIAVDYEDNKSETAPNGVFKGDSENPVINVTNLPTVYGESNMTVSFSVSGTDVGTGIEQYALAYYDIDNVNDSTTTEDGEDVISNTKTITFKTNYLDATSDYTTTDNKIYTLTVDGGVVVYDTTTQLYTVTLTVANSDYKWNLIAVDYVGNESTEKTGNWNQDVAAPIFISEVNDTLQISENAGKLNVSVEWYYQPGNVNNTVIDPAAKNSTDDVGSGIANFTFNWRAEGAATWYSITINAGAASAVTKNGFTFRYDSATGKYTVSADSLQSGKYEWYVSAQDHSGHTVEAPFKSVTTGTGTGNSNETVTETVFDPNTNYSGTWNSQLAPEFSSNYTDVEYEYNIGYDNDVKFTWSVASDAFDGSGDISYTLSYGSYKTETVKDENGKETTVVTYVPVNSIKIDARNIQVDDEGNLFFTVKDRTFADGTYAWQIIATDELGNTATLEAEEKFTIDRTAPDGEFLNLTYGPSIKVDWLAQSHYEHPLYVYTYHVKDISVTFSLENTFTEDGIIYEIRTYGKGANSEEPVRMQTFETTSLTFTLDDKAGFGVGYITGLYNNTVYWDVRAKDAVGNTTEWFSGSSFQLVDPQNKDYDHRIYDTTAPSAPAELSAVDSVEDGRLQLNWGGVYDLFGVDSYELVVYDKAGTNVIKTFTVAAKDFTGKHYLTLNDLDNGSYQFAVRAIDCAGNKGAFSDKFAFTYDVVRPDFDIDSVTCSVSGDSAAFSWDAMTDNLAAGSYSVVIKRGSIIEVNQVVTGTDFIWDNIPNFGTYTYTIKALDAEGNESAAVKTGNFVIENKIESTYKWSDSAISNVVGNGYASDTWRIVLDGECKIDHEYAASKVTIKLQLVGAESGVDVVIRNYDGVCIDVISINDCSQWTGVYYWNEEKSIYNSYTVEIVAHDEFASTNYIMSVAKEDYTKSNILDNSYEQARDNADYRIVLNGNSGKLIEDEWLGFSDDRDFRQITVTKDGIYSFDISDSSLNMTLWQEVEFTNELTALAQGSASLGSVNLLEGATYYLEIERPDTFTDAGYDYSVDVNCIASSLAVLDVVNCDENKNKNNTLLAMA